MKKLHIFLSLLLTLLASSCTKKSTVEFLPFQSEEDGRWGLISPKGEVLFTEEFEREPTVARNGRFMVRDKDGNWELYTAEATPLQVGKTYKAIAPFTENVTPATEPGQPVALIDRDGKVIKKLDKLAGKTVTAVRMFIEGLAVFETSDELFGAIDTKGNVIIEPKWCVLFDASDGKLIACDNKYKEQLEKGDKKGVKFTVLNADGTKISDISLDKFDDTGNSFADGLLTVWVKDGDMRKCGLINEKGEYALRPTAKAERIGELRNDCFTYYDGEYWGLMNTDGTVAIRAKYDILGFASDGILFAYDSEKSDSEHWKLINLKGEDIGTETFEEITCPFIGNYAPVKLGKNDWGFVGTDGKLVELPGTDIAHIEYNDADYVVESDYVDIHALVEALHITKQGIDKFTFSTTPAQAAHIEKQEEESSDSAAVPDASDYTWRSSISYVKTIRPTRAHIEICFDSHIGRAVTKPVYAYGYHIYDETTGYRFTDASVNYIYCSFPNSGKLEGKLGDVYKALARKAASLGKTVKQNKNAVVVRIDDGHYALAALMKDKEAAFALLTGQADTCDISRFADEDHTPDADNPMADAAVDTLAADTFATDSFASF